MQSKFQPIAAYPGQSLAINQFWERHPCYEDFLNSPHYLVGRRGSGKTTFLNMATAIQDTIVTSWEQYKGLSAVISMLEEFPEAARFPEAIARLWETAVTTQAMLTAVTLYALPKCRNYLAKMGLEKVHTFDDFAWTIFQTLRQRQSGAIATIADLFAQLRSPDFMVANEELAQFLYSEKKRILVAMDSLETLDLSSNCIKAAYGGLFQYVGETIANKTRVAPCIALQSEYFDVLAGLAPDPARDISNVSRLDWSKIDLLAVAALRADNKNTIDRDLTDPLVSCRIIAKAFPNNNESEVISALDQFLRLSFLTPRHLLLYLSRAEQMDARRGSGLARGFDDLKTLIARDALSVYRSEWLPKAAWQLGRETRDLTYSDVFKFLEGNFSEVEPEIGFRTLLDAGVIGVIQDVDSNAGTQITLFQYQNGSRLYVHGKSRLSIHPLFQDRFLEINLGQSPLDDIFS